MSTFITRRLLFHTGSLPDFRRLGNTGEVKFDDDGVVGEWKWPDKQHVVPVGRPRDIEPPLETATGFLFVALQMRTGNSAYELLALCIVRGDLAFVYEVLEIDAFRQSHL